MNKWEEKPSNHTTGDMQEDLIAKIKSTPQKLRGQFHTISCTKEIGKWNSTLKIVRKHDPFKLISCLGLCFLSHKWYLKGDW